VGVRPKNAPYGYSPCAAWYQAEKRTYSAGGSNTAAAAGGLWASEGNAAAAAWSPWSSASPKSHSNVPPCLATLTALKPANEYLPLRKPMGKRISQYPAFTLRVHPHEATLRAVSSRAGLPSHTVSAPK
jgi:hypothetical protein